MGYSRGGSSQVLWRVSLSRQRERLDHPEGIGVLQPASPNSIPSRQAGGRTHIRAGRSSGSAGGSPRDRHTVLLSRAWLTPSILQGDPSPTPVLHPGRGFMPSQDWGFQSRGARNAHHSLGPVGGRGQQGPAPPERAWGQREPRKPGGQWGPHSQEDPSPAGSHLAAAATGKGTLFTEALGSGGQGLQGQVGDPREYRTSGHFLPWSGQQEVERLSVRALRTEPGAPGSGSAVRPARDWPGPDPVG